MSIHEVPELVQAPPRQDDAKKTTVTDLPGWSAILDRRRSKTLNNTQVKTSQDIDASRLNPRRMPDASTPRALCSEYKRRVQTASTGTDSSTNRGARESGESSKVVDTKESSNESTKETSKVVDIEESTEESSTEESTKESSTEESTKESSTEESKESTKESKESTICRLWQPCSTIVLKCGFWLSVSVVMDPSSASSLSLVASSEREVAGHAERSRSDVVGRILQDAEYCASMGLKPRSSALKRFVEATATITGPVCPASVAIVVAYVAKARAQTIAIVHSTKICEVPSLAVYGPGDLRAVVCLVSDMPTASCGILLRDAAGTLEVRGADVAREYASRAAAVLLRILPPPGEDLLTSANEEMLAVWAASMADSLEAMSQLMSSSGGATALSGTSGISGVFRQLVAAREAHAALKRSKSKEKVNERTRVLRDAFVTCGRWLVEFSRARAVTE